jgi:IclR family KDG regulon transcriptional repressor
VVARLTPAVVRSLDILELFLDTPGPLTLADVISRTNYPRTSVHELANTLVARGYLIRDAEGRLSLGVRLFQLGSVYRESFNLARVGNEVATPDSTGGRNTGLMKRG